MKYSVVFLMFLVGCVSAPKGEVRLEMKSPERVSFTAFKSRTATQEFTGEQKVRDRQEAVDFVIRTEPATNKSAAPVALVLTTLEKTGTQNLNGFGFPELQESIEFHYTKTGKVLKAGTFAPSSLFFIPPYPLPDGPVEVGDTWELKHEWISESGGLLNLTAIGILKGYESCRGKGKCARIEVSGNVQPVGLDLALVQVASKISGELWFSMAEGQVDSSIVRSQEKIQLPNMTLESVSCMESQPITTATTKPKFRHCN